MEEKGGMGKSNRWRFYNFETIWGLSSLGTHGIKIGLKSLLLE